MVNKIDKFYLLLQIVTHKNLWDSKLISDTVLLQDE